MTCGRHWALGVWLGAVAVCACSTEHHPSRASDDATGGHESSAAAGNATSNSGSAGKAGSDGMTGSSLGAGGIQFLDLPEGSAGEAGASSCELGEVSSTGTNQSLDLFGSIVYFADGIELPAGHYRITYVDGCMKYSAAQDWAVHAYAGADPDGWWFVGNDQTQKVIVPPGTVGFLVSNGGFSTFDLCVAANLALPPVEFDFAGGKLGAWLQDAPYTDNVAGEGDRNPKWKLTLLGDCELVHWPK